MCFSPFFLLGYYLKAENLLEYLNKRMLKIISIVFLVTLGAYVCIHIEDVYWFYYLCNPKYDPSYLLKPEMYFIYRFVYYMIMCIIVFCFLCVIPEKRIFYSPFGKRTLQIYFYHRPIIYIIFDTRINTVIQEVFPDSYIAVYIIIAIVMSFLLGIEQLGKPLYAIYQNK